MCSFGSLMFINYNILYSLDYVYNIEVFFNIIVYFFFVLILFTRFIQNTDEITMIGAMPAVAVRHERRRQEKKVVCANNLNAGDREGTSNTTGNRRPSLLTLQSPHSQTDTPITSPPYIQNTLPDIYVCSKVSPQLLASPPPPPTRKGQLYIVYLGYYSGEYQLWSMLCIIQAVRCVSSFFY